MLLFYLFFHLFVFAKAIIMETLVIQDAESVHTTITEPKPKHRCKQCIGSINYGWIIVAASFLVQVINYGVIHSW